MIRWYDTISNKDLAVVGGKNASLGEMVTHLTSLGINVPDGFAVTAEAYWAYIRSNKLEDPIRNLLAQYGQGALPLDELSRSIRSLILNGIFPISLAHDIRAAYAELGSRDAGASPGTAIAVAVRSSATAEDLPDASFAGLQETYLNIRGEEELLAACKRCMASLFTARALAYREEKKIDHMRVALSVGVQKMIPADHSGSGVMFTVDTETGFPEVVMINAAWGLGESVVRGIVNPDQYLVFKPLIDAAGRCPIIEKQRGSKEQKIIYGDDAADRTRTVPTSLAERKRLVLEDEDIMTLSRWAVKIETHYRSPMDIEWVKDQESGLLYIVQARPETVHSQADRRVFKSYRLKEPPGAPLVSGLSIGSAIARGTICKVSHVSDLASIRDGCILVAQMTEPDWVPAMRNVAGIVTDFGGRTCHAAIISRELGIPAIVGTQSATRTLHEGQEITLSCAQGDQGLVYEGGLEFEVTDVSLKNLPDTRTNVMLNLAAPEAAFKWWKLPVRGVGLARMEFIISNRIQIHPMALIHYEQLQAEADREAIRRLVKGYKDKKEFFVDHLSSGIARLAASQYPHPVVVRTSDFKTNEYAGLVGGTQFEPVEENPMLGWRGASRYYSEHYREGFALECRALKQVREHMGFDNLIVMIPFCRTTDEARRVLKEMARNGLERGSNGLKVYMMAEIPSNVILAEQFAALFDGFSIGSNDLTQLMLGVDRDSAELAYLFDERNEAVTRSIEVLIDKAHLQHRTVGFCGQAPSDDPDYADFLVRAGIDSISVTPDRVIEVLNTVAGAEQAHAVHA